MAERDRLLSGTLDLLILKTLARGERHGYGIAQEIQRVSEDVLQVEEGSLYPALQRLQAQAWIASQWKLSETGRRARFYRLTAAGRKELDRAIEGYERMAGAIARVLRTV